MSEPQPADHDLDLEAKANLDSYSLDRYHAYKAALLNDGTSPEDIRMIMRGFIRAELELDADRESDEPQDPP